MTTIPYFVTLKNLGTQLILIPEEIKDQNDLTSDDEVIFDWLQTSEKIKRDQVVSVRCFCTVCQAQYLMHNAALIAQIVKMNDAFPPNLILQFLAQAKIMEISDCLPDFTDREGTTCIDLFQKIKPDIDKLLIKAQQIVNEA